MHRRSKVVISIGTAALLSGGIVLGQQASAGSTHSLRWNSVFLKLTPVPAGTGIGMGDRLAYTDVFTDPKDKSKEFGHGFGECTRVTGTTETAGSFQCTETVQLPGGDILIAGLYHLGIGAENDWPITGGTGRYRNATGNVPFKQVDATNFVGSFDFAR